MKKGSLSTFTVIVSFVCLSLVGLALIPLLPVKLVPSRTLPSLTVTYMMPNNSSRIVEAEVTSRIEAILSRIKGVEHISSLSSNGSGSITVQLDRHADIDKVRFEMSTLIRQIWPQLPQGVSYPQITAQLSDEKASSAFITYTLNAPANANTILQYAEEHIKPALGQIQGVNKVDVTGATPMEWLLEYDSQQLSLLGIQPQQLQDAIHASLNKEYLGMCAFESGDGKEWIRIACVPSGNRSGFHPEEIVIPAADKSLIDLGQLVNMIHTEVKPQSYFRINGLNAIYINIKADETANQLKVSNMINEELAQLKKQFPPGYQLHTAYDATTHIRSELNKIYTRSLLTLLILLVFIYLITFNKKYLFMVACSLTANISIALILYYLLGLEIQLYSLAGITISLNLIIDNAIVMSDHYCRHRNVKAFLPILAATLTSIGALSVIFFMDEKIRLNLQDFAAVVIVNLAVSLLVALFLVPSLIEQLKMVGSIEKCAINRQKRYVVKISNCYHSLIVFLVRHRKWALGVLILVFGLPLAKMPSKLEGDEWYAVAYNKIYDNSFFKEHIRPVMDKALGGSLRLFLEKTKRTNFFGRQEGETMLYVTASLPNGSTLNQMNGLITELEAFLTQQEGIQQFQTSVSSANRAMVNIHFLPNYKKTSYPYKLQSQIIAKTQTLGGGSWSVYGLQDMGFSNHPYVMGGRFGLDMSGYNYDDLLMWADRMIEKLLAHRRIKKVIIRPEFSWWREDYSEYSLSLDAEKMGQEGISVNMLFTSLNELMGNSIACGNILTGTQQENLSLYARQGQEYDVWSIMNIPFTIGNTRHKLSDFATLELTDSPQNIRKEDQEYHICLQFDYIGSDKQAEKVINADVDAMLEELPMGYSIQGVESSNSWNKKDSKQIWLLLLIVVIIFFVASILFNSIKQPLCIITTIPISFIGVFVTFYACNLAFDQGCFASFVLLCGITVNASIYILNEYNAIRSRRPHCSALRAYVKAWNVKVVPIILTIVSTALGFIPFLFGNQSDSFWFTMATGTIGGLIASFIGLYIFLPLFAISKKQISRA